MNVWRDVDSYRRNYGFILRSNGISIYLGYRLYRARWGGY